MNSPHQRLFDEAFGSAPANWRAASPLQQLQGPIVPFLAVCSSRRLNSCTQSHAFAERAIALGGRASVLEENLAHGAINRQLGQSPDYTQAVEGFMCTLDPDVARLLECRQHASPPRR